MKSLIQELEQKTIPELHDVANKYPYAAIYRMVLAKKLKHTGSTKEFNRALAKASLRVPSRSVLKEYLEQDLYTDKLEVIEKNEEILISDLANKNQQSRKEDVEALEKLDHEADLENDSCIIKTPSVIEPHNEEPIIDVKQQQSEENQSILTTGQLSNVELDNLIVDGDDGDEIEVEITQEKSNLETQILEGESKDLQSTSTLLSVDESFDNQLVGSDVDVNGIDVEIYEINQESLLNSSVDEKAKDSVDRADLLENEDNSIEVEIIQSDGIAENAVLEQADEDVSNQEEEKSSEKGLTIDEFQETLNVKQKDVLFHYDGFDDDEIERIADELIHEEEIKEQLKLDNDQRVEDLKVGEHDSVYKKVVEILKQDSYNFSSSDSTNHIIASTNEESAVNELSIEDHHELVQNDEIDLVAEEKVNNDEELQELNEKLDEELDLLYAQSSYESNLEYEIQEMQKQEAAAENQLENETKEEPESFSKQIQESEEKSENTSSLPKKDTHSFFAWLDRFSAQKEQNTVEKEQSSQIKTVQKEEKTLVDTQENKLEKEVPSPKVDFKQQEVDNQYRDSDDDLNDEITKEVQEKAKKSMTENRSYYTETLAYIFELQDKWEKAIEVYQELILKNPEKSAYFASQIKLLREKIETE